MKGWHSFKGNSSIDDDSDGDGDGNSNDRLSQLWETLMVAYQEREPWEYDFEKTLR